MRQTSTFSLHRIAAAIIDTPPTFTAAMSSTTPNFRAFRGRGRGGRRSFSDRSTAVSGDSHYQSVRDSNLSSRGSNTNNKFNNNNNYNNCYYDYQNLNYSVNSGDSISSSSRGGGGGGFRGRSPPFIRRNNNYNSQQQGGGGRVQRPKPADYRSWEFAKVPLPSKCERFVVLSYNIVADYLANSHRKLYFHIPRRFMSWDWRKGNILFELRLWSPDIMCFQEVDRFHDLEEDLRVRGYSGIWKMRTGDPIDGCAIFWRTTRFRLIHEECIEFNKHGMRDNVAQICVLESLVPNRNGDQLASSTSSESPNRVVVCNIHVLYNPRRGEIKLGQVRLLLERAQAVSKTWDDAPVVLCGDFNCTPMSSLYNFISKQKLDISEVDRDKVSGQASAVICPPPRQYGPPSREQPTRVLSSPTTVQGNSIDSKPSDFRENEDRKNISENPQPLVSLQDSTPVDPLLNMPTNPCEKNRGVYSSTDDLKDSQVDLTEVSTDEFGSAKCADQLINETLKDHDIASTEKVISRSLPFKEQEIKEVPISEDNSWIGDNDRLARDNNNPSMSQPDNCLGFSPESVKLNMLGAVSDLDPANICEASESNTSSALNSDIEEKLIGLSLNQSDESLEDDEDLGEDIEESLSDVNNGEGVPEDETVDVGMPSYDPSLWTPMEIETATGNASSTILGHPLNLRSTYAEVAGSSGTRDSNGEPLVTSYNTCFMGTVDYIWRSEGLSTVKVLAPISKDAMQPSGGFPTKKWGSDHIALASELAFTKK